MPSPLTSSFQLKPTPQTTDTYSPAIIGHSSAPAQLSQAAPASRWLNGEWEDGLKYKTRSGIRVRSKIEKIIADYLSSERIRFVYEPRLLLGEQLFRPDFFLPRYDLYYEHFGMDTIDYLAATEAKLDAYRKADLRFMYTTVADEPEIEDAIVDQLAFATLQ
jgi:hypothetical protein